MFLFKDFRFIMLEEKAVYTTDNKVRMYSNEKDIEEQLSSILGQKFVDYRKKWKAVNNFELLTDFPLYLQVELHQICNLRCPSCTIGMPDSAANAKYVTDAHIDWELYKKIILEGEKYGCPALNPQGVNEPLLSPDLEDHIKFASQHGFIDIMMNTNATLLSEERAKKLLDSGLTRIRFSLDSATEDLYKKVRVGGNYDTVMKNIERFIEMRNASGSKLPVVGVNFVRMSVNEHEEELFIKKWENKADFIAFQEFMPPETEFDYSSMYPSDSIYHTDMREGFNCQQPWQRFFIHNTGEVCPCCAWFSSELSMGNVANQSLYDIWNSEKMNSLRSIHKEGKFWENEWCKKCVVSTCNMNEDHLKKKQNTKK